VELAWSGNAPLPFSSDDQSRLDLSSFGEDAISSSLEIMAASSYGSMLSIDVKPLMKQRLIHTCLKYVKVAYEQERNQAEAGKTIAAPKVGLLAMVCHVICAVDISKIDKMIMHQIASILVEGLSSSKLFDPTVGYTSKNTSSKNLVLVAILKLLSVAPSSVPVSTIKTITSKRPPPLRQFLNLIFVSMERHMGFY
jgi:hypothetical protein